jgi:hypothetical protein
MHKTTAASDAVLHLIHHQHKVIVKAMNVCQVTKFKPGST